MTVIFVIQNQFTFVSHKANDQIPVMNIR